MTTKIFNRLKEMEIFKDYLSGKYEQEKKFGLFFLSIILYLRIMGFVSRKRILHNRILEDQFAMDLRASIYNTVFQGPQIHRITGPKFSNFSIFKKLKSKKNPDVRYKFVDFYIF